MAGVDPHDPELPETREPLPSAPLRRRELRFDPRTVRPAPLPRWIRLTVLSVGVVVAAVISVSSWREKRAAPPPLARKAPAGALSNGASILWVSRPPPRDAGDSR
jgi:hypothetical protein